MPEIAVRNVDLIEQICFVDGEGKKDSRVFTLTLDFMMNIYSEKDGEVYKRLESNEPRVENVIALFRKYFLNTSTMCFDEVCSKTFQFIYKMCHLPNIICQELIKDLWKELIKISNQLEENSKMKEMKLRKTMSFHKLPPIYSLRLRMLTHSTLFQ